MQEIEINDRARQLLGAYGTKAIAEAAQKAAECEQQGQAEQAKDWRRIAEAMKLMRGPHQS